MRRANRNWAWLLVGGTMIIAPTIAPSRAQAEIIEAKWGDFPKYFGLSLVAGAVLSTPFLLRETGAPAAGEMGHFSMDWHQSPESENAFGGGFQAGTYFSQEWRLGFRVRSSLMTIRSPENPSELMYKIESAWNLLLAMRPHAKDQPFRVAVILPGPAIVHNGLGTYLAIPTGVLAAYRFSNAFGIEGEVRHAFLINGDGIGGMQSGRVSAIFNLADTLNISAGYYIGSTAARYNKQLVDGTTKVVNGRWPVEQAFLVSIGFGG